MRPTWRKDKRPTFLPIASDVGSSSNYKRQGRGCRKSTTGSTRQAKVFTQENIVGRPRANTRGQQIFFLPFQVPWSPATAASVYPRPGCLQSAGRLGRSLCAARVVDAKRKHHSRAPAPCYPHRAQIRKPGWPSLLSPNQKSPKIPSIVLSRVHLIRSWHFFRERTVECVCRVLKEEK